MRLKVTDQEGTDKDKSKLKSDKTRFIDILDLCKSNCLSNSIKFC